MADRPKCIFWHRRDLRIEDNKGLYKALSECGEVLPIFIFDKNILDDLEDKKDRRINFIYQEIERLKKEYEDADSSLRVFYDEPIEVFKKLVAEYELEAVYFNHDYEPYARKRDKEVYHFLKDQGVAIKNFKDQVIFEKGEVLKDDGDPYVVYTPYMKTWKDNLTSEDLKSFPSKDNLNKLWKTSSFDLVSMEEMGFEKEDYDFPAREPDTDIIDSYHKTRNYPAKKGTTRLSVHLRFGTISVRELSRIAKEHNNKYFNELIWREFYMSILWHFPKVVDESFRSKYDNVAWRNNEEEFEKWCEGQTGFPIVDAGMRELNETGYMHNRVRMIVASFLTKHLLIDWRWGEAYFGQKLLDYELSSNNGGWQWAAGSGVDAAPYFRIFNPELQVEKYDPKEAYIKKWVPEYQNDSYPDPMVDHKSARERALETFKKVV